MKCKAMLTKNLMINTYFTIELRYNTNLFLVPYIAKQLAGDTEFSS